MIKQKHSTLIMQSNFNMLILIFLQVNMDRSGGHELRQLANNLAHENTDLKTTIAKLRYAQPLSVGNRGMRILGVSFHSE